MKNLFKKSTALLLATCLCGTVSCLKKPVTPPPRASLEQGAIEKLPPAKTHLVTKGDTLASISKRYYGYPQGWKALAVENKIRDPKRLYPGMRLSIPAKIAVAKEDLNSRPKQSSNNELAKKTQAKQMRRKSSPSAKRAPVIEPSSSDSWSVKDEAPASLRQEVSVDQKDINNAQKSKTPSTGRYYNCVGEQCTAHEF